MASVPHELAKLSMPVRQDYHLRVYVSVDHVVTLERSFLLVPLFAGNGDPELVQEVLRLVPRFIEEATLGTPRRSSFGYRLRRTLLA